MNAENSNRASGAAVGFVLAIVFFVVLTVAIKLSVSVPPVDADRSAGRSKTLATIRATEEKSLTARGWVDQARAIVR
jgi:hypothetical protein